MSRTRSFFDWLCCTSRINESELDPVVPVNRNRNQGQNLNRISTIKKINSEIINSKLESKEIKVE